MKSKVFYLILIIIIFCHIYASAEVPFAWQGEVAFVRSNNKLSLINNKNEILVESILDKADPFINGYSIVSIGDYKGVINMAGDWIVPCIWDDLCFIQDNLILIITKDFKYGAIALNSNHKLLYPNWDEVHTFNDGYALLRGDDGYCFVDAEWTILNNMHWERARSFCNGYAVIGEKKNGTMKYGIINTDGIEIIHDSFDEVTNVSKSGLVGIKSEEEKWQILNLKTNTFFPDKWDMIVFDEKSNDGFIVEREGAWGYISSDGRIVVQAEYSVVKGLSEGRIAVKKDKWAYLDCEGTLFTDFCFEEIYPFSCGLALVLENEKYHFIDEKGEQVGSFFLDAYTFSEGYAVVFNQGHWFYINSHGETVIDKAYIEDPQSFLYGYANVTNNYGCARWIDMNGDIVSEYGIKAQTD